MRRAIELNPSNAQALNYLGYSYAEMGTRLDEAEKLIRRAIDIEPEDGAYIDSLGLGLLPERPVQEGRRRAGTRGRSGR